MKKLILTGIMILILSGCAIIQQPSPEQINSADYGPFPENWKQIVSDGLAEELVRPEELYIREIKEPARTWIVTPDGEMLFGQGVCGLIVVGPQGRGRIKSFFILIHYDKPIYKVLGFELEKRFQGRTWLGYHGDVYKRCCPNLFKY